ncbi:SseB family protein [Nocardioides aquiterrae]|uniref:SseB protein N-terminal domain-containing protein n=1 Tax=Nocardioides aquiterrae TaxID=203799 RepID=A0ABP4EWS1_9ACTN
MSTSAPDDQAADQAADQAVDQAADQDGSGPGGIDPRVLLHDLANSMALLPQEPPPEGEELPEGAIALPVIEQDGTRYVPVFTSEEALRAAGADSSTALEMPLAQLAETWPDENLWLAVNPSTPEGLAIPPEVVRALPGFVHPAGDAGAAVQQDQQGQQGDAGQSG